MTALNELHVYGEEYMQKCAWRIDTLSRPAEVEIALFNSNNITVDDTTDVADVSSEEPTDGNYQRQSATLDSSDVTILNDSGDYKMDIVDQVYDTDNTTKDVTAYAVLGTFTSEEAGDSSPTQHVLYTGDLNELRQLQEITELTVDNVSMKLK